MDLSSSHLKTARAKEHLDALENELRTFYDSKPCKFREQVDIQNQRYRIRIDVQDPPDRLSLIAGDVFGCLRASLDHLVWSLSTVNTTSYAGRIQFPIMEKIDNTSFRGQISGVPTGAESIIESLQPYHGRDEATVKSHLLWRLNKLGNIDKHRRIPIHGSVTEFRLSDSIPPSTVTLDDDGIMSFPLQMRDQVKLHPTVAFTVTFGDSHEGIECDPGGIKSMYKFVANDVIPRFTGFFQ